MNHVASHLHLVNDRVAPFERQWQRGRVILLGTVMAVFFAGCGGAEPAQPQAIAAALSVAPGERLLAGDGGVSYGFGQAIAVDGNRAVVSVERTGEAGRSGEGAVHVYQRQGGRWLHKQVLLASDGAPSNAFGNAVAVKANLIVVGAPQTRLNAPAVGPGRAYVFAQRGGRWVETAILTASDAREGQRFGEAVAITGGAILVGAPGAEANGVLGAGAVYVFSPNRGGFRQQQKLVPSDAHVTGWFGTAIAAEGNRAVIGNDRNQHGGGWGTGAAYVFVRRGRGYVETQRLSASDLTSQSYFGKSVALRGDQLLVGADGAYGSSPTAQRFVGAAYLFQWTGESWMLQQKLIARDAARADRFGYAVALGEDAAVVGAFNVNVGGVWGQGAAYIFSREATGFREQAKLTLADGSWHDRFGWAVALENKTAMIGAPHAGPGLVQLYHLGD